MDTVKAHAIPTPGQEEKARLASNGMVYRYDWPATVNTCATQ